jgi:hypothetical protein
MQKMQQRVVEEETDEIDNPIQEGDEDSQE